MPAQDIQLDFRIERLVRLEVFVTRMTNKRMQITAAARRHGALRKEDTRRIIARLEAADDKRAAVPRHCYILEENTSSLHARREARPRPAASRRLRPHRFIPSVCSGVRPARRGRSWPPRPRSSHIAACCQRFARLAASLARFLQPWPQRTGHFTRIVLLVRRFHRLTQLFVVRRRSDGTVPVRRRLGPGARASSLLALAPWPAHAALGISGRAPPAGGPDMRARVSSPK